MVSDELVFNLLLRLVLLYEQHTWFIVAANVWFTFFAEMM